VSIEPLVYKQYIGKGKSQWDFEIWWGIVGINEWALAHSKINSLENHKSPPHGMACMWSLVPPCLF
ncbi:hypothetical protein P5F41_15795, partial [Clostridium perfringens]|nr:hypothetical protein [Clostridium perfringens]